MGKGEVYIVIVFAVLISLSIISLIHVCLTISELREELHRANQIVDFQLSKYAKTPDVPEIADVPAEEPNYTIDEKVLTEAEIQRVEEEAEFDLRIARIKDELANRTPDLPRKGTEAIQFHPDVRNLPHNVILDDFDRLPDVEFSS